MVHESPSTVVGRDVHLLHNHYKFVFDHARVLKNVRFLFFRNPLSYFKIFFKTVLTSKNNPVTIPNLTFKCRYSIVTVNMQVFLVITTIICSSQRQSESLISISEYATLLTLRKKRLEVNFNYSLSEGRSCRKD